MRNTGCTGFSGKLDALLWALRLETPDLDYYCQSIVSLVSDQGGSDCDRIALAVALWGLGRVKHAYSYFKPKDKDSDSRRQLCSQFTLYCTWFSVLRQMLKLQVSSLKPMLTRLTLKQNQFK